MIKLKDILKEDEVSDKFGDVALGSSLALAKLQGKKKEDNTGYEDKLLTTLRLWVLGWALQSVDDLYSQYNIFKKAAKKFPSVFLPDTPNGTQLYRGLQDAGYLTDKIEKTKPKDWKKEGDMYVYTKPIKYKPYRTVQSWTDDVNIAKKFSGKQYDAKYNGFVLLTTKQTDEFLFSQKLMKYLYKRDERETLHFGTKFKQPIYLMIDSKMYVGVRLNTF